MNKPLTNEQIWGVPDNELPEPEIKDYFEYVTEVEKEDQEHTAEAEPEA